ncbi:MAG TPA: hypothetical protein VMT18_03935 [Planctomycetota bacterium]|nr:hypothetical protein [Planctomycetota bacterium]
MDQSKRKAQQRRVSPASEPFSVIPAKQWQEAWRRLNEEAKRTAKLLLNRTDSKGEGVEFPYKLKPGIGARNNFTAALHTKLGVEGCLRHVDTEGISTVRTALARPATCAS